MFQINSRGFPRIFLWSGGRDSERIKVTITIINKLACFMHVLGSTLQERRGSRDSFGIFEGLGDATTNFKLTRFQLRGQVGQSLIGAR